MSRSGNIMTVQTTGAHGLGAGNRVYINAGSLCDGATGVISVPDATHISFYNPGANASAGAGGYVQRGAARLADGRTFLIDIGILGTTYGSSITVAGVADGTFNGDFAVLGELRDFGGNHAGLIYISAGSAAVSGGGTVTANDGPGQTQVYYVTIADPARVGDTGDETNLTAYCEASAAKVGGTGYTYCGSIIITHGASGANLVSRGGWPISDEYFVNGA
jgi:hypothetical protein